MKASRTGAVLLTLVVLGIVIYFAVWTDDGPAQTTDVAHAQSTRPAVQPHPPPKEGGGAKASPPSLARKHTDAADMQAGIAIVPPRFRLPGVVRVATADSFADWQAKFPSDTRKLMAAFNQRYFGIYRLNSPKQVAWMAAHGYPMPEDLVRAQGMSDQQLLDLVEHGNLKAAFLLRNRDIATARAKIKEYLAAGKSVHDFWHDDPFARTIEGHRTDTYGLLRGSVSPFKGFLQARLRQLSPHNSKAELEADAIAGLYYAYELGDSRVSKLLTRFIAGNPRRRAMVGAVSAFSFHIDHILSQLGENGCHIPFAGDAIPQSTEPLR